MTNDAILAWGGGTEDCSSQATIDYMKGLGFSEFQYVSSNLDPRKDICDRMIANGIFPVYDVEGALWAGSFSAADISWAIPQLNAIKAAGWKGFSSEGMFGPNVEILRKILPFVNYGGENGEYMIGGYYNHWLGQHTANYMECYHSNVLQAYKNTALLNNKDTPHEMGLCWMMYPQTADLEMNTSAMQQFIKWGQDNGITWRAFLFWAGENDCPTYKLRDGEFIPLLNMVKGMFNIVKRTAWNQAVTPPPPPPVKHTTIVGSPATAGTYVFVRGSDNALWFNPNKGVGAWTSLGGIITSSPGAVQLASGAIVVNARGANGEMYSQTLPVGGKWSGWDKGSGQILASTDPAPSSTGDVYVIGNDISHSLYRLTAGKWTSLGYILK